MSDRQRLYFEWVEREKTRLFYNHKIRYSYSSVWTSRWIKISLISLKIWLHSIARAVCCMAHILKINEKKKNIAKHWTCYLLQSDQLNTWHEISWNVLFYTFHSMNFNTKTISTYQRNFVCCSCDMPYALIIIWLKFSDAFLFRLWWACKEPQHDIQSNFRT